MWLNQKTLETQNQLADFARTGNDAEKVSGAVTRRLKHYRRLVFNNFFNTLSTAFPITKKDFGAEKFRHLVTDFIENHDHQTPQIWRMPKEFVIYARENNWSAQYGKPYLDELLEFEWIEIDIHTMPDKKLPEVNTSGDLMEETIGLNPEFEIMELNYPVHKLPPNQLEENQGKYYVLIYREHSDFTVQFTDLSPLHVFIIENLKGGNESGRSVIPKTADFFGLENNDLLKNHINQFLYYLKEKGCILGTTNKK